LRTEKLTTTFWKDNQREESGITTLVREFLLFSSTIDGLHDLECTWAMVYEKSKDLLVFGARIEFGECCSCVLWFEKGKENLLKCRGE
jgi:hypothetical protein